MQGQVAAVSAEDFAALRRTAIDRQITDDEAFIDDLRARAPVSKLEKMLAERDAQNNTISP